MKKVVLASDNSGFRLKEAVKKHLLELGYVLDDVGMVQEDTPVAYYDAAVNLAKAMQTGNYDRGIVICGTGAGVSMIVNKFKHIYCVACESVYTAERCSLINNANVLAMGENVVSYAMGSEMAEKWLAANWCEGFSDERRKRNETGFSILSQVENENFR
ncbi:RpiB/LacA/LacB family sugar-phosphate isomerase [Lawsonibacter sp. LCP25S3_G6]|uniref:RpiB/LacA/LacB family sugar-phosphate isomerase n=1 Tax=unclassified Lawsonibacter TaxID=2617946 RepID=UPI003F96D4BA